MSEFIFLLYQKCHPSLAKPSLKINGGLAKLGLIHCGLVTPYGDVVLGPHWSR